MTLIGTLADLAERERDTVMLGRTHGQAAVPITFGLKVAVFLDEFRRHLVRLDEIHDRICVGKFLGAVGTGAAQGINARELQRLILTHLDLSVPMVTTQVVGRDRYIEWVSWMANVATSVEKLLQEIRNLQRSEIEVGEWFDTEKQVGSSTMAQKKSNHSRKCVWTWLELFDPSSCRHTKTRCFGMSVIWRIVVQSDLLYRMQPSCWMMSWQNQIESWQNVLSTPENMIENIERQNGLVMAEKVMIELVMEASLEMKRTKSSELPAWIVFPKVFISEKFVQISRPLPVAFPQNKLKPCSIPVKSHWSLWRIGR